MNPRVQAVKPNPDYTITLWFTNGEVREFDVKPYLDKGFFQELKDFGTFNTVKPFLGSVQWKNGQDFCPDSLYEDSVPITAKVKNPVISKSRRQTAQRNLPQRRVRRAASPRLAVRTRQRAKRA